MKGRESGMPAADYWNSFFDAAAIIRMLECAPREDESIVEFGSGYGTFSIPAARATTGIVTAFDIEPDLVEELRQQATQLNLLNLSVDVRDFIHDGTGLPDNSVDHVMLYNILHIEDPVALLSEARRILKTSGTVSVIHWRSDIATPRGPTLTIRPQAQDCVRWAKLAGFDQNRLVDISTFAPYHFGLILHDRFGHVPCKAN